MFRSATIKLTAWYVAILIAISLLFSSVIYVSASHELNNRLTRLQEGTSPTYIYDSNTYESLRQAQVGEADHNIFGSLAITNICIWIAGGFGSYWLARRTLRPIEEAHETQSRFTSDASHEFRTPLASMTTELEVALRDPTLKKTDMKEVLESTLEEVHKLSALSQALLQLSHMTHDTLTLQPVNLRDTFMEILHRFEPKKDRLTISGSSESLFVSAHQPYVEELMTILVDNALKYSPTSSKVSVQFIHRYTMNGFIITNSGEGIPSDALPHIFDRFYRVDHSRTGGEAGGHGLGLSLAKQIVEQLEGELSVTSAADHETSFTVLLPEYVASTPTSSK